MTQYQMWVEFASDMKSPKDVPETIGGPKTGWVSTIPNHWSRHRDYYDGEKVAQIALKFHEAMIGNDESLKIQWKAYLLKITKNAIDAQGKR